jgi:ABC-type lipoprotein release transport system permease subunit
MPSVLVSRQLAEAENVSVGQTVTLAADPAGAHAQRFRVAGIYEPLPDPMRLNASKLEARLHLPDLQALTASPVDPLAVENVDAVNIALRDAPDAEQFSRDLMARVPGLVAQPVKAAANRTGPFLVLERFHLAIAVVTILASTVFLLALTVMLVDERRETIGVLRLIGLSPSRLLVQVFAEGVLVASLGAAFGILLAIASQGLINRYFQWPPFRGSRTLDARPPAASGLRRARQGDDGAAGKRPEHPGRRPSGSCDRGAARG